MKIFLWIGLAILAVICWLNIPDSFWQYLFFLRVPILSGLFLIIFPYIATQVVPNILRNLFVLRSFWQIALTIASTFAAAIAVTLVAYIVIADGPSRFGIPVLFALSKTEQYILAIALSLPISITTVVLYEKNPDNNERDGRQFINERFWGAFLGIVFAIIFFGSFDLTRYWLSTHNELKELLGQIISFLTKQQTDGYIDPVTKSLTTGHLTATAFFLSGMLAYGLIAYIYRPQPDSKRRETPALLYLMLIATVLTLAFGGLTFFFDFYHILPLLLLVITSIGSYILFNVYQFFALKPLRDKKPDSELRDFEKVLENRLGWQPEGNRTLIIVCASGGGIQAAAWTVQVLTGLQEWLEKNNQGAGEKFAKAIGFISSVSGGSVGSMYYLDRVNLEKHYPDKSDFKDIFKATTQDSLDAVGWGLAYPDLWRLAGLPFLTDFLPLNLSDRGKAMETDWQGELKEPNQSKSLDTWRTQVLAGQIPIPIFNATIVEDGRRFLISPMTFASEDKKEVEKSKFLDFNTLYSDYDINIVTAARLSATFPYISPIAQGRVLDSKGKKYTPIDDFQNKSYHIADGGYFDNSGIFTMVEWLDKWPDKLEQKKQKLNFKKVIFIEINAFPKEQSELPNAPQNGLFLPLEKLLALLGFSQSKKTKSGWVMAILGPLLALYSVSNSTQTSRNSLEIELIQEKYSNRLDIHHIPIFFPSYNEFLGFDKSKKSEVSDLFNDQGKYQPPLSWKLTEGQKQAVKDGWTIITEKPKDNLELLQKLVDEIQLSSKSEIE